MSVCGGRPSFASIGSSSTRRSRPENAFAPPRTPGSLTRAGAVRWRWCGAWGGEGSPRPKAASLPVELLLPALPLFGGAPPNGFLVHCPRHPWPWTALGMEQRHVLVEQGATPLGIVLELRQGTRVAGMGGQDALGTDLIRRPDLRSEKRAVELGLGKEGRGA